MDWQTLTAAAVVMAAVVALVRQAWHFAVGGQPGGCGNCPSKTASSRVKNLPLVQLGPPEKPRK